jgi:hypothetical protein
MNNSVSKKKIIIFSYAYEPLVGGAEIAVREITDRLSPDEFAILRYLQSFAV